MNTNIRYYIRHMENIGLLRHLSEGQPERALDLGCGRGVDAAYLTGLGYEVTAVDVEPYYAGAIVRDLSRFVIEPAVYSIIICHNVLPFILSKKEVTRIIHDMTAGLRPGGVAYFTVYGPNSGFKDRSDMSFFTYDEILAVVESLPVDVIDKTTSEGFVRSGEGKVIYQHAHKFMVKRRGE